jgi:hypothetical protein
MNLQGIARLLALCALVAALMLTIAVERSPASADQWNVTVTFEALNASLFVLAALLFWFSSRLPRGVHGAAGKGQSRR